MATAAIAFIGCTAIGMEKTNPVMMLNKPAKNSAEAKSNPFVMLIPTRSGRNVPRSPSDPEISCLLKRGSAKPDILWAVFLTAALGFKAVFLWFLWAGGSISGSRMPTAARVLDLCSVSRNTSGALTMDHQLFAVNARARRRRNPGKRLLRQAGHLITPRTKEMDVVSGTLAIRFISVPAKPPDSVHPLNSVNKACFLKGPESSIHRHTVEILCSLPLLKDVLMRQGLPRFGKQLQDRLSGRRAPKPTLLQQMNRRLHGCSSLGVSDGSYTNCNCVAKGIFVHLPFSRLCGTGRMTSALGYRRCLGNS
jgi:hypothetical protein